MKRFENAQVGDKVYCRLHGEGVIMNIDKNDPMYAVTVRSTRHDVAIVYTYDGKEYGDHVEATLFYRSDNEKYLTERPIDWTKVPTGTEVRVSDSYDALDRQPIAYFLGYFPQMDLKFWVS